MSEWAAKRFYESVTVHPARDGFEVHLDDRTLRTPFKSPLILPTRALADALAGEWRAQEGRIDPLSMPVTRAANSAIDKVGPQRDGLVDGLSAYAETDLLCYRADAPPDLVARQAAEWDPILDWAEAALGARLVPTKSILPLDQDPAALARLRAQVAALTDWELTGFSELVSLSGSLILGFAVVTGARTPERAWDAACIDEAFQAEAWGWDDEARERLDRRAEAFARGAAFVALARGA
ncbi:MAG: ATP12 family chaperone protein [Paracoccaceae bacterium]